MNRLIPVLAMAGACSSVAVADTATGTYTQGFSSAAGIYYGNAGQISDDGGQLKLTINGAADPSFGTWVANDFALPNGTGPITSFSASFKYSFYGSGQHADGFSFLFGNLTDDMNGSGDYGHGNLTHYKGGEWGMNQFSRLGTGLSVGLDRWGSDAGVYGRWSNSSSTYTSGPSGNPWTWSDAVAYTGGTDQFNLAMTSAAKATMFVDWNDTGYLRVQVAFTDGNAFDIINGTFAWLAGVDTTNFTFGFAGRTGGASIDTFIDDLNVSYQYSTPVVPGPAAIAGLAGLGLAGRRRRR